MTKCMEILKIVDYSPQQEGKVFFGAWVEIENDDGDIANSVLLATMRFLVVKIYISIDSPMARALLKKEVGDLAVVNTSWWRSQLVRERD
ncbi:GreA/GreB family elongation factor [Shigella flexneri]